MRKSRKILGIMLAVAVLASSMAVPAMAEENSDDSEGEQNIIEEQISVDDSNDRTASKSEKSENVDESDHFQTESEGNSGIAPYGAVDFLELDIYGTTAEYTIGKINSRYGIPFHDGNTGLANITIGDFDTSVTNIVVPETITGIKENKVVYLAHRAFQNCSNLVSVTLPNTIKEIGVDVFSGCISLKKVSLPNSMPGPWLFSGIGHSAFTSCSSLETISIPDGIESIRYATFLDCISLNNIRIPESVTEIEHDAFSGCKSLTDIYFSGTKDQWNSIEIDEEGNQVIKSATIHCKDGDINTSSVASFAVTNGNIYLDKDSGYIVECEVSATKAVIPSKINGVSVVGIKEFAFYECASLTSVTLPAGMTTIERAAFGDCIALESITIPSSITQIGEYAFYGCSALKDIYYSGTEEQWNSITIEWDGQANEALKTATIHYNGSSSSSSSSSSSTPSSSSRPLRPSTTTSSDDDDDEETPSTREPQNPVYGDGTTSSQRAIEVTASALTKVIKQAKDGQTAKLYIADSAKLSKSIIGRITAPVTFKAANYSVTFDPAKLTEKVDIQLGVKPSAPAAQNTFETYFNEPVAAISCSQKGTFGGTVYIDINPNKLASINTGKPMYVYSWNQAANSYKKVGYAVLLKNGWIRCYTDRGYDLVISNADSFTVK